ncbi:hypothetical protein GpartN1_g1610.t1 [Galdieria partita]|uniref:Pyridoxal phosphate homeostasis protein n=1 Tax=Galdieria partita TaxID=83374 RepID=A0A9C7UND7_9RHOD|nr:hypothetical protein GpartN1_g1610.t1 [Galdieria partita]
MKGPFESCWIFLSHSLRVLYSPPRRPFGQCRMCTTLNTFSEKDRQQGLVRQALCGIVEQVRQTCVQCGRGDDIPRIVAVSKTKPPSMIMEAYDAGHRHFGENYVQELVEKAATLPKDIQWHFIGHLQSNKVKRLLDVDNLWIVETVDRAEVADALERQCVRVGRSSFNIYLQVNTSNEETKSGCSASQVVDLARRILETCPHLSLKGLMTIGRPDVSQVVQDFETLKLCRDKVEKECQQSNLELSMGMSNDWKEAVVMGSNNIRIGSALFGERQRKK